MEKIYLAPLEGITGHVFRSAYHNCINPHIDKYFTPFISPNQNRCMSEREKRDILPENNRGIVLVPQILTKDANRFLETARELKEYGYTEVNLNLGCPSPTVTTKKKGAGMLADLTELKRFLDDVFTNPPVEISIKTRLGIEKEEEWEPLLELYNRYPVKELIVHARLLKDFYGGKPRREAFGLAMTKSVHPLCYNGDIFSQEDYRSVQSEYDGTDVMLGRGILFHPALSVEIMRGDGCNGEPDFGPDFWAFHDQLVEGYRKELSGDAQVIQKMKELWSYMITDFPDSGKIIKKIKKAGNLKEYMAAVLRVCI